MKPELWKRIEDFFAEVADLGAEDRAERLEAIRKTDPELHTELKSLIEAHDGADELLGDFEKFVSQPDFDPPPDPVPRLNAALEGRYTIDRALGEGGMATVYLAHDLKHARKVAIKVLRPELAAIVGAERFLTEIKTTANLQHPNILPLFDSGEADSFLFYVMPYVEGDTLRDRLDREGQLPVSEAVAIAEDIAEALQAAHEQGVIHRDIKPGNVLISRGKPLIADFGIALALTSAGAGGRITEAGLSLGTPYYMSPEQATGDQAVGPPADTYSLGCVLYEMLVGAPPHDGRTAQAVLSKIVAGKPTSAMQERPSVPANVDAAVRKALEKLPADRFASAREFADALEDEYFRYGELATVGPAAASGPWNRLSMGLAGLLAVTVLVLISSLLDRPIPNVVRLIIPLGRDADLSLGGPGRERPYGTSLAISPEGEPLVYSATVPGEGSRLYLHRWAQERDDPIEGTEGATFPFFSPDGAWIGFFEGGALRRLLVADFHIETVAESGGDGATWGDDGTIVFVRENALYEVADSGGEPELLAEPDTLPSGSSRYSQPHMLPGSEVLLFQAAHSFDPEAAEIVALNLTTGTQKTVLTDAMDPRYIETGHLLFMRQGTLWAVGFDLERLEVQGQPVIMVEDVMHSVFMNNTRFETGAAQVAVSASGHLAYALGGVYPRGANTPVIITSTGEIQPLDLPRRRHGIFRVSPDGTQIAFHAGPGQRQDIYVHHLVGGTTERVNNIGGFTNSRPSWSPDGLSLAFSSDRDLERRNIFSLLLDGSAEPERLAPSDQNQSMSSWSSGGDIAWLEAGDIWVLPPDGLPAPFFESEAMEAFATFSPDGRWLAYMSNRNGRPAVYRRPYPGPGTETLISDRGSAPAWSPDGAKIYYTQAGILWAVDVNPGEEPGRAVPIIDPWPGIPAQPVRGYDVFADGSFVHRVPDTDTRSDLERFGATELHVVLDWAEELKERLPN